MIKGSFSILMQERNFIESFVQDINLDTSDTVKKVLQMFKLIIVYV